MDNPSQDGRSRRGGGALAVDLRRARAAQRRIERAEARAGVTVFHAGTAWRDGRLTTAGGRVLGVTALGADLRVAVADAYRAAGEIRFDGVHYRRDIGHRALERLGPHLDRTGRSP